MVLVTQSFVVTDENNESNNNDGVMQGSDAVMTDKRPGAPQPKQAPKHLQSKDVLPEAAKVSEVTAKEVTPPEPAKEEEQPKKRIVRRRRR